MPARVFRISFSGELAYEVNVDANLGRHVWEALFAAGEEFGMTPYGTEAMHVLRAEKGYIIVGQDTDGSMTPADLGLSGMVKKKGDFIGRRSLARSDMLRPDRKQLVGLLTEDGRTVLPEGAQLVDRPGPERPIPMLGHVTSSYMSPVLDRSIAFGFVKGGQGRMGETVHALLADGRSVAATISRPVFLDPENKRMNPAEDVAPQALVSVPRPKAESPLVAAAVAHSEGPAALELYERPFLAQVGLRGDANDAGFRAAVASVTGLEPPQEPNCSVGSDGVRLFWLSPDEWLVQAPAAREASLVHGLRQALADRHAAVTVLSGGQTVIGLRGAEAAQTLAKGCTPRPPPARPCTRCLRPDPARQGQRALAPPAGRRRLRAHRPSQLRQLSVAVAHRRGCRARPAGGGAIARDHGAGRLSRWRSDPPPILAVADRRPTCRRGEPR